MRRCKNTQVIDRTNIFYRFKSGMDIVVCSAFGVKTFQKIHACYRFIILGVSGYERHRGDEVRKVMHFDMTWERREGLIREEERAEEVFSCLKVRS